MTSVPRSVLSVEIFFQNHGGKNRVSNSSNHGESFLLLCTLYRSIYVRCFMAENVNKWLTPLDITAVVGATRLQESFRLVVNLRGRMDLFHVTRHAKLPITRMYAYIFTDQNATPSLIF